MHDFVSASANKPEGHVGLQVEP